MPKKTESYVYGIHTGINYEYPGKVTQVINFTGCNFDCRFCNDAWKKEFKSSCKTSTDSIISEIEKKLHITDSLVFSGGEPLLQKEAVKSIMYRFREVRKIIKTNGSQPKALAEIVDLVDFVELNLVSPLNESFDRNTKSSTFFKSPESIKNDIIESIRMLSKQKYIKVKTNLIPGYVYRKDDLESLAELIDKKGFSWELTSLDSPSKGVKPLNQSFINHIIKELGKKFPNLNIQGC